MRHMVMTDVVEEESPHPSKKGAINGSGGTAEE
jgi:hypothetical protein